MNRYRRNTGSAIHEKGLGDLPEQLVRERQSRPPLLNSTLVDHGNGHMTTVDGRGLNSPAPPPVNQYKTVTYPFIASVVGTQGGVARAIAANPLRAYLLIQNQDAASAIFVNFGTNVGISSPTTGFGARILAGGNYELIGGGPNGAFVPPEDVYIVGATGGEVCFLIEGSLMRTSEDVDSIAFRERDAQARAYRLANPLVGGR